MGRLERERHFHDLLAKTQFKPRKILNRMATAFYDKSLTWGPVWKEVGDFSGKVVLDYGSGKGEFSIELARKGGIVYGIDISEELVQLAKQNIPANVHPPQFIVGDAHHTPFPDQYFDLIVGNGILHHLDLGAAYREIRRILKPGGVAYFLEPLALHPLLRIVRYLTPQARSDDERPLTFQDIAIARRWFSKVAHQEYFLLSVALAPVGLLNTSLQRALVRIIHRVDEVIFDMFPWSRHYAWITMITLE